MRRWPQARILGRELVEEWRSDRVGGLAAEIAFFALLGFFPLLLALAAALGSLEVIVGQEAARRAQQILLTFLERALSDDASGTLDAIRRLFQGSDVGVVTMGMVLAVWAGARSFAAIIDALDIAYDVEERRSWLHRRLIGAAFAVGTVVMLAFVLAALVVGPLLGTGREIAELVGAGAAFETIWAWLRWPAALLVLVAWATTILHLAPDRVQHRPWRRDLPGAVATMLLWITGSLGLRLYLALAGDANDVLGLLGGGLIVVLWLYLLAVALLVGGELNRLLEQARPTRLSD